MKIIAGAIRVLAFLFLKKMCPGLLSLNFSGMELTVSNSCSVPTKDTILLGSACGSEGVEEK